MKARAVTDDVTLAFAHPAERAAATAPDLRDRISVRDHVVEVEIGAFQAERGVTQRIRFNVVVEVAPLPANLADDVDLILSYDRITEAIEGELSEERLNLLETLAERVADRILLEPQALRAFVRIEKLDRGPGTLGVEIARTKPADQGVRALADTPEPIILCLSNAAIASDRLTDWIDVAERHERPVILCVGFNDAPAVRVPNHKMVQRRIDLLAIEQNAWVLASHDDRCVVVETRTELDWGLRNDQISVWAPSKLVLDSVEGPGVSVTDIPALVAWFAGEMNAAEIVFVGMEPQQNAIEARFAAISEVAL